MTAHVENDPVSHNGSEIHAEENGNLERREVSKIEDRVQCQMCLRHSRPGETFCTSRSLQQGITEEVKKQAEQRTKSRFIMSLEFTSQL